MLPLRCKNLPSSRQELAEALDRALRQFVQKDGPIVEVHSRVFPYVDEIALNLDRARFDSLQPTRLTAVDQGKPAFEAAAVRVSGRNVALRGIPLNIQMEAFDVVFYNGTDANGDALLLIHQLGEARLTFSAQQLELENAIAQIAAAEASRHGIALEQVRLAMRARGPRSLALDLHVQARKFLVRARIDIAGQVDIDENFTLEISSLRCKGEGMIGSLACNALAPTIERLNDQSFPVASLPLGEIKIRDVRLAVADTVEITADFGV
jgi:hypothetical protein